MGDQTKVTRMLGLVQLVCWSQITTTKVTRMLVLVWLELKRGLVAPDWGVWLQLNGGKHQEGRSQVLTN